MTKQDLKDELVVLRGLVDQVMKDLDELLPDEAAAAEEKTAAPSLTMEEIRGILAEVARRGHASEVKAILEKHGVKKLSELPEAAYEEVAKEARGIK